MGSCVDGPVAGPTPDGISHSLQLAPQFGYAIAAGTPALSTAEIGALNEAFDLVNGVRLIVSHLGTNEVLLDIILALTPSQDVYDLAVDVPGIDPGEQVSVMSIAIQGETTLFESPPLTVPATDAQTATPPSHCRSRSRIRDLGPKLRRSRSSPPEPSFLLAGRRCLKPWFSGVTMPRWLTRPEAGR